MLKKSTFYIFFSRCHWGHSGPKNAPPEEKKILSELEEDLARDAQLRHAVSPLASWDVMVGTLKLDKQMDNPTHLSFDSFNR